MAGGGSTQQSLRKALGALKDSTKVGLAKVNSDYKSLKSVSHVFQELDVAIVKATNHVEEMAKEKHIRSIFDAASASRPRADVAYCIHGLARRLSKTHNWAVALKTLIVIHRALREVDPTFLEELINYSRSRGHMLNLSHFKDDSSPNAWDYSAWVRMYALYLEERLECFRILKYDVETDRVRTRELDTPDLLEQLPALQQLLFRLLACQPEGAAIYNNIIQYALSIVAGESVRLYSAINDGTLNLVDKFFEMQRHDAVRALEIYRKAGNQAERLSEFYEICRGLEIGRGQKFIKIEQPPASFITAMEEYVKETPRPLMLQRATVNDDRDATPRAGATPKAHFAIENKKETDVEEKSDPPVILPEPLKGDQSEVAVKPPVTDLLGLGELSQEASVLDEKNALALAIVTSEKPSNGINLTSQTAGWELALVSAPSSNGTAVAESKLAGGLDKLTLDSLYDDAMTQRTNQNGSYHNGQVAPNPFAQDPFYASNGVAPPTNVQMAAIAQQQQAFIMQQQQMNSQDPNNPFGNPYMGQGAPSYPPHNPYTGLI
ncbi:hypothetical protein HHK36_021209 [Tetracentron sinense]|uniref:ENTH domain-containing protein n=1 Tax=Tetracentron sinense TaxID=13715 RepID=A0A835D752_TETSI|nr:hypothetical protein HHK36_021209 [Tetracentron sinense]